MSYEADECYRVYQRVVRRARKPHECGACKAAIAPGDHYCSVHIVGSDGGSAETIKRCGRCELVHRHLAALDPGWRWPAERLDCGLDYVDEWGGEPPDDVQALAFVSEREAGALLKSSGGGA